jgi:DNA polymerase III delta subunit
VIGLGGAMTRIGLVASGGPAALERELKPFQRWMARRTVPQARRWTLGAIDAALEELLRADRLLKSASLTDRQVLEECLLRMWGASAAEPAPARG